VSYFLVKTIEYTRSGTRLKKEGLLKIVHPVPKQFENELAAVIDD